MSEEGTLVIVFQVGLYTYRFAFLNEDFVCDVAYLHRH